MKRQSMSMWSALIVSSLALLFSCSEPGPPSAARGVTKPRLLPENSAGIFVGVSEFDRQSSLDAVPFAVDDAVDLAYLLSFELRILPSKRVSLLLSGDPQKSESQNWLRTMRDAGVQVEGATRKKIERIVKRQARRVDANGVLILSFATHGFTEGGIHYLMASDSTLDNVRKTGVRTLKLFDSAAPGKHSFRLMFVDACRERLVEEGSGGRGTPDPRAAMTNLFEVDSRGKGQVILTAAQPGGYAYDNFQRKNGVFTAAVLDGLRCQGQRDGPDLVTPSSLHPFVNQTVAAWTERHYPNRSPRGSAIYIVGEGMQMTLNQCESPVDAQDVEEDRPQPVQPPTPEPAPSMPAIEAPVNGTRLGEGDGTSFCLGGRACFRIRVRGTVPRGYRPFLAVAPANAAPRIWIQQKPLATPFTGSFSGVVQLGEEDVGAQEWFSIFVFAHRDGGRFRTGETMIGFPSDCLISEAVDVYRAR